MRVGDAGLQIQTMFWYTNPNDVLVSVKAVHDRTTGIIMNLRASHMSVLASSVASSLLEFAWVIFPWEYLWRMPLGAQCHLTSLFFRHSVEIGNRRQC